MNDNNKFAEFDAREEELFKRFLEKQKSGNKDAFQSGSAVDSQTSADEPAPKVSSQIAHNASSDVSDDKSSDGFSGKYADDTVITSVRDLISAPSQNSKGKAGGFLAAVFLSLRRDNIKKTCSLVFAAFLLFFLILNILTPSKGMSEKENRMLAQFPTISWESITSGRFMKEFESYISDQFVFRNHFVASKRRYETLSGKKENRSILICKDGYLIENTSELTQVNLDANISAVNAIAGVNRYKVTVAVLPTAYEVLKDKLPKYAYVDAYAQLQQKLSANLQNVQIADVGQELSKYSDKYIYYRSDHHQTALGSYVTYAALGDYLGYEPHAIEEYAVEKMADDFCGTAWSNSGFAPTQNDIIYKYSLEDEPKCQVNFPKDNKKTDSVYSPEMLKGKDKYAFYADGNHAVCEIKSDCDSQKRLAIIKDSYAHSIVPFLTSHYSEIYMIDLRYFNDDVFEYLYNHNITDVLVLYNQNTFMTDSNLSKVKGFASSSGFTKVPDVSYGVVPVLDRVEDSYFDDAVFVGDSLTIGIANFSGFNSDFLCMGGLNTKNLETDALPSGKSVMQSIKDMEHMGKIYIMLGTNEVAFDEMESFLERYSKFIDDVRVKFPNVIVYIESIMPVTKDYSDSTNIKNDKINIYNEQLLKMAKEKQCYYVDVHSYYEDENGCLPDNIGSDGVHLGPEKYREFADYLRDHAVPEVGVVKMGDSSKKTFAGGGKTDIDKIAENILKTIEFKDELAPVADSLIISNYRIDPSKVCSATLYLGGGATAEEIAVFEAKDEKYAKQIESLAKERIERRKKDFENYIPGEMKKLNSPVIVRKGKVVVLCVADKVSKDDIQKSMK